MNLSKSARRTVAASVAAAIAIVTGIFHYAVRDSHSGTAATTNDKWDEWGSPHSVVLTDPWAMHVGEQLRLDLMAPAQQHSRDIAGVAIFLEGCIIAVYKPSLRPYLLSVRIMSRRYDTPDEFIGNQPIGSVRAFMAAHYQYCHWQYT